MSFEWPLALVGLLAVPLAVLLYVAAQRRATRYATRFPAFDVLADVAGSAPAWRRHVPVAATLAALSFLVVAVARPQRSVAVPRERATVMLTTDTSASMAARDVLPSRLDAAKQAAERFADATPAGLRLGLISFAAAPSVLAEPTRDRGRIREAIDSLQTGPATATGDALLAALDAIRRDGAGGRGRTPAAIVLLSDGKTTSGSDPRVAARRARRARVPIYTVALGTDGGYVQIGAANIAVPPDRAMMRAVAALSGGRSYDAFDGNDLSDVYARLGSRLGNETERREVTAAFAAGGLVLLVVGVASSLRSTGRLP